MFMYSMLALCATTGAFGMENVSTKTQGLKDSDNIILGWFNKSNYAGIHYVVQDDIKTIGLDNINKGTWYNGLTLLENVLSSSLPYQDVRESILLAALEVGVNPNVQNKYKESLLLKAQTLNEVESLVRYGCNINAIDRDGNTVLKRFVNNDFVSAKDDNERREIIKYLQKKGACTYTPFGLLTSMKVGFQTNRFYSKSLVICAATLALVFTASAVNNHVQECSDYIKPLETRTSMDPHICYHGRVVRTVGSLIPRLHFIRTHEMYENWMSQFRKKRI